MIVYDSHIDTVGGGDLSQWGWNPFKGVEKDGAFYALLPTFLAD